MARKWLWRSGLAAVATAVAVLTGPSALAAIDSGDHGTAAAQHSTEAHETTEAHGITAEELEASGPQLLDPPAGGWDVPSDRSYHLEASCQPHAAAIAKGAAAWADLDESGGTPVECRNSYITDCGSGGRIVGCNWGQGQRIALYMGGVNDDALLAAHEFGHDWYGHSGFQCAGWGSPEEVMAPSICNYEGKPKSIPID